jgi:hypothetical protein
MTLGAGGIPAGKNEMRMGIKAYHGSPHDFNQFDIAKAGSTTDSGNLGRGLYFSTDPRVANQFTKKYEVDLDIASPLEISLPNMRTDKRHVVRDALSLDRGASSDAVASEALKRGYDSVVLDYAPTGYAAKEIAVFNDKLVRILRKYGVATAAALPAAALAELGMSREEAKRSF